MKKKNTISRFFQINKNDGIKYASTSGDKNKIHIDKIYGYNSIFGENIIHGTLIISKFLKLINFKKKNQFFIQVDFKGPFYYKIKIYIEQKKSNTFTKYYLIQGNIIKAIIIISNKYNKNDTIKNFHPTKFFFFHINESKIKNEIDTILYCLSKYVGMIYPGKNSLISNLKFYYSCNTKFEFTNKILISSNILKPGFPIIINNLKYKNYHIYFESLFRPELKKKKIKISKNVKRQILKIKENVLIIGASQGIGNSLLKIFNYNKKIKKFATYNMNKINLNFKNIFIKKINVLKDLKKIYKIVEQNSPIRIYYLPTTKIHFEDKLSINLIREYENFFYTIPLQILNACKRKKIHFFYPSTTNIELNKRSVYSKIKLKAEKKILNFCKKKKLNCHIHRFPAIYSRQSISILNNNPPSLTEYLGKGQSIINSIFPLKFDNLTKKIK